MRLGRVWRSGNVEINVPLASSVESNITIPVCGVAGAMDGRISVAWRTNELPDGSIGDAAGGGRRRVLRGNATGRRRTRIVVNPVGDLLTVEMIANVI